MANFNYNKVILGGRLASDPTVRDTSTGKCYCTVSIAVNRKAKDQPTDFFQVIAWERVAEFISKYFHKGSSIMITGSIRNRRYTDKDGKERFTTNVVAESADWVDSRADSASGDAPIYSSPDDVPKTAPAPAAQAPAQTQFAPNFEPLGDDEELPF